MGFLSALTGSSTGKATISAANQNKSLLDGLLTKGNAIIDTGEQKSDSALTSAIGAYQPWVTSGTNANTMYDNAIGLNGADGNAAAVSAFRTNPGYDFAVNEAEQAGLRAASAGGMLASGNTLAALSDRRQGMADQAYNSWLDRLAGKSSEGLSAAGGQASGYGAKSNLYQQTAGDRLGLESGVVQGIMGANNQIASGQEAKNAAQGGFLKSLINGGVSLLTKGATGGLF